MADRKTKLRLGAFVALGIAGFTGLTFLFGGAPKFFSNRATYVVLFSEAPGLAPGTPVRKSGVRIGEVTALDLDEQTAQVRVTIQVEKKYLPRQNEEATISRGLLNGDTTLDFVPKQGSDGQVIAIRGESYPPEMEIAGQTPINPNTLVRQASGALPSAQESMARVLASVQRFEQAVPKIEKAFEEIAGLARSGRELVPELRRTNDKVQGLLAFADVPGAAPGTEAATLKATLADVRDFIKTAKPLIEDIRKVVKDNEQDVGATVKAIRKTVDNANELLNDENKKAFGATLKNVQTATDDVTKVIRLAAIILDQGEQSLKQINARLAQAEGLFKSAEGTLKAAEGTFKSAEGAVKNIETATKPLAENAEQIIKNVNITADQLSKTLAEVRETLRAVNRADGTLQKVLTDPALYNSLNDSAASLTRTLLRAEKIAQDLQVFADKVARRPEVIGVGGAVRPSAGLKESPNAPLQVQPFAPLPPNSVGPVVPSYRQPLPPLVPRTNLDLPLK